MFARVYSGAVGGAEAFEVESKDRRSMAIINSGFPWLREQMLINLAPAEVNQEEPSFDLPVALAMIACAEGRELPSAEEFCFLGELASTGAVRAVRGVWLVAMEARQQGCKKLVVPYGNVRDVAMVEGLEVYGVHHLREAYALLLGLTPQLPDDPVSLERMTGGETGIDLSLIEENLRLTPLERILANDDTINFCDAARAALKGHYAAARPVTSEAYFG